MSSLLVAEILATRLATLGMAIEAENAKFTPTAGVTYLRERVLGDFSQNRPVAGGARNNRSGLYQVTIMAPKDSTRKGARMAAELIEQLFYAAWRGSKLGTTVTIQKTTIEPTFTEGERYALPITVQFFSTSD